jgi:hypothetical protein
MKYCAFWLKNIKRDQEEWARQFYTWTAKEMYSDKITKPGKGFNRIFGKIWFLDQLQIAGAVHTVLNRGELRPGTWILISLFGPLICSFIKGSNHMPI